MTPLEKIRAKLHEQQNKAENRGGGGDRAMYPFWNTPEGQSSVIRFLPDGDPSNVYFWVERLVIKLPFQGIKGDNDREVLVQVPCMEMYGETCPVLAETRPWWKDDSLTELARKYWKKKSYLFNGFVVSSGFEEKDLPENPIRRFAINTSIFEIIKSSLMNPEMEDLPTDYISGRDFKLTKTKKGEFANYSTSNWSFKTRSLSPAEQEAVSKYGPFNLKEFLPKKPGAEELAVIKEMFHASVNDEQYDPGRWGNYYKPFGLNMPGTAPTASAAPETAAAVSNFASGAVSAPSVNLADDVDEAEKSFATPVVSGASDALARLRSRTPAPEQEQDDESASAPIPSAGKQDARDILRKLKERQNTSS